MNKYNIRNQLLAILVGVIVLSCALETLAQDHTLTGRRFQGIPSLAISPEGRLWATWYAGITPGEDQNNYVVVASSGDNGKTWKEILIIDPDAEGPVRAFDPELWLDPEGRLWSFWAQTIGHDGKKAGVWARINHDPNREGSKWSQPRKLTDGIMMCKPTVLSSGEWILSASTWRDTDNSARVVVSTDKGQTFNLRGACNVPVKVRSFDEHMIVERKDRSLWMLVRTKYGIGESVSKDRGETWSTLNPSSIQHPSARFFVRRLHSGNLLLVKHGPVDKRTGRSHLTAYVSDDDGRTWSDGLYSINSTVQSTPYFTVSFLKDDVLKKNGEFKLSKSAEFLNPDFHVETITKYTSANVALPIKLYGLQGELLTNIRFELERISAGPSLVLYGIIDGKKIEVASCSLINSALVHSKEAFQPALIEGSSQPGDGEVITLTFQGRYSDHISQHGSDLYLENETESLSEEFTLKPSAIEIDGYFQEWRNIDGVKDIKGDHVSYLYANPDTDLLEFKISNDEKYLYIYSRVAGAHGRTGEKGRYYWYAYIDVDRDASTGYPPTRDDNCYFGISIGDDCEAQFEFVGNRFIKTFFGFTGIGSEKEALSGELTLGPSYYSPKGRDGEKRESYKIEYVHRNGSRFITHDYTEGTSQDIIIALSPDGSEVEVKVELAGFLKDTSGNWLMVPGKKIDIAVGVEGSSDYYGSDDWGADSSPVIYGYLIK